MRAKLAFITIITALIAAVLSSCAASEESMDYLAGAPAYDGEMVEESASSYDTDSNRSALKIGEAQERLIIRTGNLDVVIQDTEESLSEIARMAERMGGWVVSSNVYQRGEAKEGRIIIRIPAEQFDAGINEIKEAAIEVQSESTESQDVTEEFVDVEARLANLESTARRVRSFLEDADNVEEALAVNQELSRLEGEIESLKGRRNYLSQSAAFSSLSVNLTPDELSQPIEVAGWRPEGVAKSAIETLISAVQGLANVAIWGILFCLPLGLLVGVPLFFIGRFIYRRRRRMAVADEEE
ncbi:MAG: DUF4349 domain-containing protein [Candidatus Promineifilaceae bacterium]|jgi:hypothetical protein